MPYRQLKPREQSTSQSEASEQLSPEQMAAYHRQSSNFQVLNNQESMELQLTGAQKYAISQGLDADKILVAIEGDGKRGVSGTLRIDQREKLQEIMAGIAAGKIKIVWAYSVSRLFRDKYGVQVGTFVEACADKHVKVVIETAKTFDFSNSFDILMFQFLANVAARENEDRSKLLHDANKQGALRGEYNGRPLLAGFIVDRDKQSPTFGRYIPYAAHREVVERLFRRFRELGGRFNLLWNEVSQMSVVFPTFNASVDARNIKKFQYRQVPGGYHISKKGLFNLLTSVEYVGYWKTDGQLLVDANGAPIKNHAAIVPLDDWQYAFNSLSFVNLDGSDNTERAGRAWVPATKQAVSERYILPGILTSPLGTIQQPGNEYRVAARLNENTSQRSNVLTVSADMIEYLFRNRLLERIDSTDYEQVLADALTSVQANNAKALVTVDEQIARYQKSLRNIDAWIDDNYADADKQTKDDYNEKRRDAVGHLAELEKKKSQAAIEERSIRDLCTTLNQFRYSGAKDNEHLRRFIKLITESIVLNEYSSRFITLTITWAAPFRQVDVCYIHREDGGSHQEWTEADEYDLAMLYPLVDREAIMKRFPTCTWGSIVGCAGKLGIPRYTFANTSGITDRFTCYADWELYTAHGWKPGESTYWDLATNDASGDGSGCR